jgi:hypothetical protein
VAHPNVPELTGYQRLAADLRAAADLFDKAADVPMRERPWVQLDIQPGGDDEQVIDRTDRLGAVLFGKPGQAQEMHDGTYHYDIRGMVGAVQIHVFDSIAEATVKERERQAELVAKEAELARLRAEVERLRAERCPSWPTESELKPWESLAPEAGRVAESMKPIDPDASMEAHYDAEADAERNGLNYGRGDEGMDPTPTTGRVEPHTGAVVDGGRLVTDGDPHECEYPATCLRSGPHQMPEPSQRGYPIGSI